jgi:hypothetical protein
LHALVAIYENMSSPQLVDVRRGGVYQERLRRQKAMPAGASSACYPGEGQRDDLLSEQGDHPLDWSAKGYIEVTPPHRFLEGDCGADALEHSAEKAHCWLSDLDPSADQVAPRFLLRGSGSLDDGEFVHGLAELCGKRLGGTRRATILERGVLGRANDLFVKVELFRRDIIDEHGKTPRCAERPDRAVRQSNLRELIGDDSRKSRDASVDKGRR